jgi:hypothetical protein
MTASESKDSIDEPRFFCRRCHFTFTATKQPVRCPRCLRISAVEPLDLHPKSDARALSKRTPQKHKKLNLTDFFNKKQLTKKISVPTISGILVLAATGWAALTTDFENLSRSERLGSAATYAVLAGVGLALLVIGLIRARP